MVPGYILLAWFFCVVFQPLGLSSVPEQGNNIDHNDECLYEIVNLQDNPGWGETCGDSGHILTEPAVLRIPQVVVRGPV